MARTDGTAVGQVAEPSTSANGGSMPADVIDDRIALIDDGSVSIPRFPVAAAAGDVADYLIDFSGIIGDDTIVEVRVVSIAALVPGTASSAPDLRSMAAFPRGSAVAFWLTGGKPGWRYLVGVVCKTSSGRTVHRSASLAIAVASLSTPLSIVALPGAGNFNSEPADPGREIAVSGVAVLSFGDAKDPLDVLDLRFDLNGLFGPIDVVDQVLAVEVRAANRSMPPSTLNADPVVQGVIATGQAVTVWISDGQPGWRYEVSLSVRTLAGRQFRRSGILKVASL